MLFHVLSPTNASSCWVTERPLAIVVLDRSARHWLNHLEHSSFLQADQQNDAMGLETVLNCRFSELSLRMILTLHQVGDT